MTISSRTPEGERNRCPVCGHRIWLEPSRPPGDAPCPCCGTLLWFPAESHSRSTDPGSKVPVTVDLPGVQTAWEYGTEKIKQGDVAGGLAVLGKVVAHEPNDVAKRRALREMERTLYQERENQGASLVMMEVWSDIRQARHKRAHELVDWDAIDRAAERGLAVDPWNVELNCELGQACSERGYRDAARFAYSCALQCAPDRGDIQQRLTELDG